MIQFTSPNVKALAPRTPWRRFVMACLLVGFGCLTGVAQRPVTTVPEVGVRDRQPSSFALTNATIIPAPGELIEQGNLLIERGLIIAVGADVEVPDHARVIDMQGKTIYPALIDSYSEVELNQPAGDMAHWNKHIRPERNAATGWAGSAKQHAGYRKAGFGLRLIAPSDGILKGTSAVVTTADADSVTGVVAENVAQHLRLTSPRGASRRQYPNSPMGAVALARQTFYDADWYDKAWTAYRHSTGTPRPESNDALKAISAAVDADELFIFDAPDEQYVLRANRFAVEFGLNRVIIRDSGRAYQRLDAIVGMGRPLIVPLNFPKPPNVGTVEAARDATLAELMHWRLAPENPARLMDAGARIAFTTFGLDKKSDFLKRVRKAVERGLEEDAALAACTTVPAELFGVNHRAGSISVGKDAHLMITDGDWLAEKTKVVETWVDGVRYKHETTPVDNLSGTWELSLKGSSRTLFLSLKDDGGKLKGSASSVSPLDADESEGEAEGEEEDEDEKEDADEGEEEDEDEEDKKEAKDKTSLKQLKANFGRITATFSAEIWAAKGSVRLTGTAVNTKKDKPVLIGELLDESGKLVSFKGVALDVSDDDEEIADEATEEDDEDEADEDEGEEDEDEAADKPDEEEDEDDEEDDADDDSAKVLASDAIQLNYPIGAFGAATPSRNAGDVLIENATVWTCGPAGILQDASILIQDGQIIAVGKELKAPKGVARIDAKGKHISPGIIDCHSHMATDGGVNEGTQAITAEVRIGDFIDATDITIWRQLAGGVTSSNILHGSANPIGGQNQVIKLRWGMLPEEMKFVEAPQGIKFALGENVKQSNWGSEYTTRYPQSRLGVEQIMRDALIEAQQYGADWEAWRANGKGIPPRRDLELDAILEIVNGQRWIHCHSYRQDEILALIRTLDAFDITIGSFQHILEGYKVAKEMAEHGAMGSSFSDWWAYKVEVFDAIPYNGALMHRAGVVVSFNSDDAELGRHLNHEAAKAMKYGGLSPEEALKFVTLNPARQLRIDQYVGSLEPGKHADLVIWSGDPLQITSRCEQTWIDGIRYFDIKEEKQLRRENAAVRERLVRMILDSGEEMKKPGEHEEMLRHMFPRYDEYCGHGHGGHEH